ncbi:MAG: prephenate dehydratase [Jaaginema sp. PMC 1079.18]|nr:prephenate dehydratase [Jaaginema sp. PMC 1079.18]
MTLAHLGPPGTYTEAAALAYAAQYGETELFPYGSIAQTLQAVARSETDVGVVPVENSIQGSVAMTLDTIWLLDNLHIQQALVLPIQHVLISLSDTLEAVRTVYSHPQALGQCQRWLETFLPAAQRIAAPSTTDALTSLQSDRQAAVISSRRAAQLYHLPILAENLNDYPDNCTRFWVLGPETTTQGSYISLAFAAPANVPGALVNPLQVLAEGQINMSRIESRPTKRLLGEYIFFVDIEGDLRDRAIQNALEEFARHTASFKIFGNYDVATISG